MSSITKLVAAVALCTPLAGCLGNNNAFDGLTAWNRDLTDNKWANEVVFLGLNIVPVYGLALLGDYLIFNSVEFWTGDNPIDPPKEM